MSGPWWTREGAGAAPPGPAPALVARGAASVIEALRARRPGFTWDWRAEHAEDAGLPLLRLLAEQGALVRERLARLPERTFFEFLGLAGVRPRPGTPAGVILQFTYSKAARASLLVPRGFQVGGPADGGELVFETERDLHVAPAEIERVYIQDGDSVRETTAALAAEGEPLRPFPAARRPGRALLIGLRVEAPEVRLGPTLSLEVRLVSPTERPPPAVAGGVTPRADRPRAALQWSIVHRGQPQPVSVVRDGTDGLSRSGVVELRLPRVWDAAPPPRRGLDAGLRWLQLRRVAGRFEAPPAVETLRLNTVEAVGRRTFLAEPLEPAGEGVWQLRHAPVVPESLVLTVDEGLGGPTAPWRAVVDLRLHGPEERVFQLDPSTGRVRFGDGVHGVVVPPGFRHVVARRYAAAGGAGRVEAEAVTTLLRSAPLVTGVSNPRAATGGAGPEPRAGTLRRGPESLRARGRAVTAADYALLAPEAPKADVARAHAMPGIHPGHPGRPLPGVVGVLVVPPDRGAGGPPTPDEDTLAAVADHLATTVAPAGVEVVTAAPRYHTVRVEASIRVTPTADVGATIAKALEALDRYVHPLTGGDDGAGWPFGAPLRHVRLLHLLAGVDGVGGVPALSVVLDGLRLPRCADAIIPAHDLLWPVAHDLIPEVTR